MNPKVLMKSIAIACGVAALLASPVAFGSGAVIVSVENVVQQGSIRVALFDEANWLSANAVAAATAEATGPSVVLRLTTPSPGRYAVAVYQDVNGDGRLNRNALGLPQEPVGFSNGARIGFGPPSFKAASVEIGAGGATIAVRLGR